MNKIYSDDRQALAQEIWDGLKGRGHWVPKAEEFAGPDLINAVFMAIESLRATVQETEKKAAKLEKELEAPYALAVQNKKEAVRERSRADGLEKALKEGMNILGGPVTSYAPEIAMEEFGKKIQKAVRIFIQALGGNNV